jgi:hypothetical protein
MIETSPTESTLQLMLIAKEPTQFDKTAGKLEPYSLTQAK